MISLEEAQTRLLALALPLPSETLEINKCFGRYLAADILAQRTQPSADMSAMDGYAVRFGDLHTPLKVIGESAAGKPYDGTVGAHEAVRIFTGAHLPDGADSVIMQEDISVKGSLLSLTSEVALKSGAHIRKAGTDFVTGQLLLTTGQILNAGAIAAAIMGGFGSLEVGRKPKIVIIGSGDELMPPGHDTNAAKIPSSNNGMLYAMLHNLPCDVIDMGIVGDNVDAIISILSKCSEADIIVTSGGASVGDHDLIQTALIRMGAQIDFWRVALKPGKPLLAGRLGKSVVLGLPGNPGSAYVTAYLFLLPLVRHLSGCTHPWPTTYQTSTLADLPAASGRTEFLRAVITDSGAMPLSRQDSGLTTSLAAANALIIRPADAAEAKAGKLITYHLV